MTFGDTSSSWFVQILKKITPRWLRRRINQWIVKQNAPMDPDRFQTLQAQLADVEVSLQQVVSVLRYEANCPPLPPRHLQVRVVGGYVPDFYESGFTSLYPTLNRVLEPAGKELKGFDSILDGH